MQRLAAILLTKFMLFAPFAAWADCTGRDLSPEWSADFTAAVEARAADVPYGEGRFFEVEKNGAVSVLFGTIHLADDAIATPPPALVERIESAKEVLIELSEEEEKRMMRNLVLNPFAILAPEGKQLSAAFSPTDWAEMVRLLKPFGVDGATAERIAPWYLLITLSNPPCVLEYMARGQKILDRRIEGLAKDLGITATGLETYEEVFGLFGDLPYETQVDLLRVSLPTFELSEDYLATTRAFYEAGEIAKIEAFGTEMMRRDAPDAEAAVEQFFEALLTTRNARWMERLLPKLEEGGRVVAVGALHLGGEDGLLLALERAGFTVRRLDG